MLSDGLVFDDLDFSPETDSECDTDFEDLSRICEDETCFQATEKIHKLLDCEHPRITRNMLPYLSDHGVAELFIRTILRASSKSDECNYVKFNVLAPVLKDRQVRIVRSKEECVEKLSVKRAYTAMALLCNDDTFAKITINKWIDRCYDTMVTALFDVFSYQSVGLYTHFVKVYQRFLKYDSSRMLALLLDDGCAMLKRLIDNSIYEPIMDALVATLRYETVDPAFSILLEKCGDMCYVEYLLVIVCDETFIGKTETLLKYFPGWCNGLTSTHQLFGPPNAIRSSISIIINKMVHKSTSSSVKYECINTLLAYYTFWREAIQIKDDENNNKMKREDIVTKCIIEHIPILSNFVATQNHELYLKKNGGMHSSMNSMNLTIVEFVYSVLTREKFQIPSTLELDFVVPEYWKMLSFWFLKYEANDIFHSIFFRYFAMCIKSDHTQTLQWFLVKSNLIQKLLEFSASTTDGRRGISLLMCAFLKLISEMESPESCLNKILYNDQLWLKEKLHITKDMQYNFFGGLHEEGTECYLPVLRMSQSLIKLTNKPTPVNIVATIYKPVPYKTNFEKYKLPSKQDEPESFGLGSNFAKTLGLTGTPWSQTHKQ